MGEDKFADKKDHVAAQIPYIPMKMLFPIQTPE